MSRALLVLALMGLGVGIALGQPSNLSGGVFICHYVPEFDYTVDPDPCGDYPEHYAISNCGQQITRADTESGIVWYVLAAFNDDKVWCGTEFGLNYAQETCVITGSGQCPENALIIPSGGWPGPGTGISIAATTTPWSGNFQPVFWFTSYAYGAGEIRIVPHPATGFGGFSNCATPPTMYAAACFGALGLYQDGIACCPAPAMPHACCVGNECVLVYSANDCTAQGGVDHPDWASCDGNPCGGYLPSVCCVGHECVVVWEEECAAIGGHWLPDLYSCGPPNPCDQYTPATPTTWGAIKAVYR
jgi:hypothetical protein